MADPILIVAALNGTRDRKVAKKLPLTPAEIAKEAKRAVEAGAGVVHVHARRDDGGSAFDLTFDEIVSAIRALVDVPISITTQRTRQTSLGTITALFDVLRELPELATVNVQPPAPDLPAHREEARQILEACERAGVAPEPAINTFEAIADVEALYEDGLLAQAPWLHLELGGAAGTSEQGLAGTPRNLLRLVDALDGTLGQLRWIAHAEGTATAAVCATGAALGGHLRVGLEDSALLPDGTPAASNGELVELAVALADALGREPMEPAEARRLLRG
jgi:3-keto-5-aminohexanoate cleavage enzyme